MKDRRSRRREPTILQGYIQIEGRATAIECTVRNISDTGAQISVHHPLQLPNEFTLSIPRRDHSSRVRIMWSRGKSYGVQFVQERTEAISTLAGLVPDRADGIDSHIQNILESTRGQLAQYMGVPVRAVRLSLEIDPLLCADA